MGKFKPHKGLGKRVKVSGGKKIIRRRAGNGHLFSGTPRSQRRRLRRKSRMVGRFERSALRALGAM